MGRSRRVHPYAIPSGPWTAILGDSPARIGRMAGFSRLALVRETVASSLTAAAPWSSPGRAQRSKPAAALHVPHRIRSKEEVTRTEPSGVYLLKGGQIHANQATMPIRIDGPANSIKLQMITDRHAAPGGFMKALRLIGLGMLAVICVILVTAAVLVFPQFAIPSALLSVLARAAIAVFAGAAILTFTYFGSVRPLQRSSVHPKLIPLPPGRAVSLQRRVGQTRTVTSLEAEVFALAVTNPALFRRRVTETYEPSRRTVAQTVAIDIQIPTELLNRPSAPITKTATGNAEMPVAESDDMCQAALDDGRNEALTNVARQSDSTPRPGDELPETPKYLVLPFPAVVPVKGELNDGFEIYGVRSEHLPTYSYSEYLELVASVLRMLLLKACDLEDKGALHKAVVKAELVALRCIMQRGLQDAVYITRAVKGILDLKSVNIAADSEPARTPDADVIRLTAELVRLLANRYAIVALIECNNEYRSLLYYKRTVVPGLSLSRYNRHAVRWLKERLAILLGARPVLLSAPLTTAATCQSYHLVVRCPEGLYLGRQMFPGLNHYLEADSKRREALRKENRADVTIPPYYHVRSRLGQPYAHFYSRYFAEPTSAHRTGRSLGEHEKGSSSTATQMTDTAVSLEVFPKAEFKFLEVPPGSLFRGTLAGVGAFLLIWIVGFIASRGGDPGADAPAILLAFPAVLAGWVGVDAPPRRLLEGTLSARLSLLATAILALGASALYMIYRAKIPILHGSVPSAIRVSFLGITQGSWGILAALALSNALYIGYCCAKCTWEYKSLCGRRSPLEHLIEGG